MYSLHSLNVEIDVLKEHFGDEKIDTGCIGNCAAYDTEANGIYDDELVVAGNTKDFINKINEK